MGFGGNHKMTSRLHYNARNQDPYGDNMTNVQLKDYLRSKYKDLSMANTAAHSEWIDKKEKFERYLTSLESIDLFSKGQRKKRMQVSDFCVDWI